MSATALSNTSSLWAAGFVNPEIFLTNWRAAASMSSSGAGVAPSLSRFIDRHICRNLGSAKALQLVGYSRQGQGGREWRNGFKGESGCGSHGDRRNGDYHPAKV